MLMRERGESKGVRNGIKTEDKEGERGEKRREG